MFTVAITQTCSWRKELIKLTSDPELMIPLLVNDKIYLAQNLWIKIKWIYLLILRKSAKISEVWLQRMAHLWSTYRSKLYAHDYIWMSDSSSTCPWCTVMLSTNLPFLQSDFWHDFQMFCLQQALRLISCPWTASGVESRMSTEIIISSSNSKKERKDSCWSWNFHSFCVIHMVSAHLLISRTLPKRAIEW